MSDTSHPHRSTLHDGEAAASREHARTALSLHGSYRDAEGEDHACMILDISPGGARIETHDVPCLQSEVSVHIVSVGRLSGRVVRTCEGEFGMQFSVRDDERDRVTRAIVWQFNKERLRLSSHCHDYQPPEDGEQTLTLGNGRRIDVCVREVSLCGVAYLSAAQPEVGELVCCGPLTGRVTRLFSSGFAVVFDPPEATDLEKVA